MRKLLEQLDLHLPTIGRDLLFGLLAVTTAVFAVTGAVNYLYTVERDNRALNEKAAEITDNLASVLATPMWNLNTEELNKVVEIYRQSGVVNDINLIDDAGGELVPFSRRRDKSQLELSRVVAHEHMPIGRVTVIFSDTASTLKQEHIAAYSLMVFTLLTVMLTIATSVLLRRVLKEPLARLVEGLTLISQGNYGHQIKPVRQVDINEITTKVMLMAGEIAKRERALEQNRSKLEILNQAILDIFSCSDTSGLVRQTMTLSHKVCGIDHGWFLPQLNPGAEAEMILSSLVSVRGQIFEATEREVTQHIHRPEDPLSFTFPIKSRYDTVGTMTLAFATTPDSSVVALLRSLMSLATLAMIRQSFIRETAFIAAELQVAETVQRSMLVDEAKMPRNALISYHYEPVLRVGGDWFNVIESRDGGSVYIILGDVTGHGIAQGLITTAMAGAMNIVESLIRDFDTASISKPSDILTQLNSVIHKLVGKSNLRMTCVAAQIDFKTGKLIVCNAGHTFPLVLRQSAGHDFKIEPLARNQQYMLGDDSSPEVIAHKYSDAIYEFRDDDLLLLYTDGLTEAIGKDGRPFVRKFHRHVTHIKTPRSAAVLTEEILSLFKGHTMDVPVKDDICLVVVSKKPAEKAQAA